MNEQQTKALATFMRMVENGSTAPLVKALQDMRKAHALELKEATAALTANNGLLTKKLAKAIKQRDEWQYQARKYRATILEKK